MLSVGVVLLLAAGGYYTYAQFVKTGRDELVHAMERPVLPGRPSSAPVDDDGPGSRPSPGQVRAVDAIPGFREHSVGDSGSRTDELPSVVFTAVPQTKPFDLASLVADIQGLNSSGLRGALRAAIEASRPDQAPAAEALGNGHQTGETASIVVDSTDGRIGAAIEELHIRQARRGMNLPGYVGSYEETELVGQLAVEYDEQFDENASTTVSPSQQGGDGRLETATGDHMVALRGEIGDSRTAHTSPEPQYATRITVPGIGLISPVEELEVIEVGDSRAWETPKYVVGHIPTTARPGASGQGWYFGHLESPLRGEGNVFHRLPELAARFKKGERFTINLDAGGERYVYQVYRTDVVHRNEFVVTDSGLDDITLVSCWPQYVYSERILVTAALVDVVEVPEAERRPMVSRVEL